MKKWERLSEDEIKKLFLDSSSKREVARKIGYNEKITLERVLNFS